jgi:hypothetical protein
MLEYRAYRIGDSGHFVGVTPLFCSGDLDAIAQATNLADGHDVELWSGERFIIA